MIRHMVFVRFKPDTTEEDVRAFERALAELSREIAKSSNWYFGPNLNPRDRTFDFATVCEFPDWSAFTEYIEHPAHVRFREEVFRPRVASRNVVDIEC